MVFAVNFSLLWLFVPNVPFVPNVLYVLNVLFGLDVPFVLNVLAHKVRLENTIIQKEGPLLVGTQYEDLDACLRKSSRPGYWALVLLLYTTVHYRDNKRILKIYV